MDEPLDDHVGAAGDAHQRQHLGKAVAPGAIAANGHERTNEFSPIAAPSAPQAASRVARAPEFPPPPVLLHRTLI
ncbi:MAG: hypothetical protein OEM91_09395 [Hyphomicrobiales bacterium]|nr:hypothetical protein [Hyphomicrobiales bacterium]